MRRHRVNEMELPGVIEGLRLYLLDQVKTRADPFHAFESFKAYFRFVEYPRGKPDYPREITWEVVAGYIGVDTVPLAGEVDPVELTEMKIRFAEEP